MNIYDIAKEAGVSISTVSRVLNNKSRVSQKTIEKVRRVMEEHNYSPNPVARGLVNKSLRTIGIVTVDIRGLHYASLAYSTLEELNALGYNCLFCNAGFSEQDQERNIRMMAQNCIDGVIFIGSTFQTEAMKKMISQYIGQLPVVMVNSYLELPNIYSVLCDDQKGVEECVAFLMKHGHKHICYIGREAMTASGERKMRGYVQALQQSGIEPRIIRGDNSIDGGGQMVETALKQYDDTTAYIFENDMQAVGGTNTLIASGIRVPENVEIITYNDSFLSMAVTPHLTCVNNKLQQIGKGAAKVLHEVIEGGEAAKKTIYSPTLLERDSTRKQKTENI